MNFVQNNTRSCNVRALANTKQYFRSALTDLAREHQLYLRKPIFIASNFLSQAVYYQCIIEMAAKYFIDHEAQHYALRKESYDFYGSF